MTLTASSAASATRTSTAVTVRSLNQRLLGLLPHFDGSAALLLRLILAPVMIAAGCEKMHGENWFHHSLDAFPFPFNVLPADFSWFLAMWTEFLGGICLLLGIGTRIWAVALAITMFVAAYAVHLPNGWPAIAPSQPPAVCIPDSPEHAQANAWERYVHCYNVNQWTLEAAKRLQRTREVLQQEADFSYLNGMGALVKLNNGIEFATMYLAMLLALLFIGGGRYVSLDWLLVRWIDRGSS
jgi:putative oxidoreductase